MTFYADAGDWDAWQYNCGCYGWVSIYTSAYLNYTWSDSIYLQEPFNGYTVEWYTIEYTPELHSVKVTVTDDGAISQIPPEDSGSRDDSASATDSVAVGAFDVKAAMTVSGTNTPVPSTTYVFWSDYDGQMHYGEPGWEPPPPAIDYTDLAGGPISLGNYNDNVIEDDSSAFPEITFRCKWVLSSEPEGKWTADQTHTATCLVDRNISGTLHSKVWDEDEDFFPYGLDDYVSFTPAIPSFGIPISWNWNRILWALLSAYGASEEAEAGTGMGLIFQSDYFSGSSNWEASADVKHQSKDYSYTGTTPNHLPVTFSYGSTGGQWWQIVTEDNENSILLKGDIQGKIELVEYDDWISPGFPFPAQQYWFDAYVEAWSEGSAGFGVSFPSYAGMAQPPDPGYPP